MEGGREGRTAQVSGGLDDASRLQPSVPASLHTALPRHWDGGGAGAAAEEGDV